MDFKQKLIAVLKDTQLRKKILFVIIGLILFRLLASIPVPGVDAAKLLAFFRSNQLFGLLDVFSGSGLSTLSIVMLGVGPYITSSIIMQLLTMIFPGLKALYHEEGEAGRLKFTQYSRRITVPLAIIQAYGFLTLLIKQGLVPHLSLLAMITNIFVITAGSMILMWLGELMTEYGIGNGVSMIIFGGIVARMPQTFSQLQLIIQSDPGQLPLFIGFGIAALLVVWVVVIITEAERPVPVTYAKRVRGERVYGGVSTYLPLRVNQAGVIPIIFALSLLLLPQMVFNFLAQSDTVGFRLQHIASLINNILNNPWFHSIFYFVLVFVFTYFYTAVTFDPKTIADNLQKSGAFIPGVRPGQSTTAYLAKVVTRITLVGAVFLAVIAVLPLVVQGVTGSNAFAIGGTALLIVVSVIIDLVRKLEGQLAMREY